MSQGDFPQSGPQQLQSTSFASERPVALTTGPPRAPGQQGMRPVPGHQPVQGYQGPRRPLTAEEMAYVQQQRMQRQRQIEAEIEAREHELELKYGADQVLALIIPVSLCMVVVIATLRSVAYYSTQDQQFVYSPYQESSSESSGERFSGALLNVIIIIGIIVVMTFVLVILYKYRCYRAIHGWLLLSSMLLLFFFSYQFVLQVLEATNTTMDYITMCIAIWNFGWVGLVVIHWRGPLLLQQVYLIAVSSLMALVLIKYLPEWTTWILLGAIAVYDLAAVLCPGGPLRMLVETAQERDEPLFPALVYSSTAERPVPKRQGDVEAQPPRAQGPPTTQMEMQPLQSNVSQNALPPGWQQLNGQGQPMPRASQSRLSVSGPASNSNSNSNGNAPTATTSSASSSPSSSTSHLVPSVAGSHASPNHYTPLPTTGPAMPLRPLPGSFSGTGPAGVGSTGGGTGVTTGRVMVPGAPPTAATPPVFEPEEEEEAKGVKLGLGDFIFYSVLVGKAATSDDWGTIFVCYVAILIGLAATLLLLSIFKKALPALPISIFFGLVFYFITSLLLTPFLDNLTYSQVFV
eukprot:m.102933 g.102933  ORF g.102933 m.102933 type:complete len:575 (-) comp14129_c2_seq1:47-1771(-)